MVQHFQEQTNLDGNDFHIKMALYWLLVYIIINYPHIYSYHYNSFSMYTRLITKIETTCHRLGKDDKFQLFVCLSVHDRLLGRIVTDLTKAVAAQQVSGIHDYQLNTFLTKYPHN